MNSQPISANKVVLIVVGLILFFAAQYLFTHSLLTIETTSQEEVNVYIRKDGFEEQTTLQNSSQRFLLNSGDYEIEVISKDGQSIYHKKLGFFGSNYLSVDLIQPRSSTFVGKSQLNCARQIVSSPPLYYSCDPSELGLIDSGLNSSPTQATTGDSEYYNSLENTSLSLQPYGRSFLEATVIKSKLIISERSVSAQPLTPLEIKDFEGEVSDGTFSTSGSGFAVYDTKKSTLHFGNDLKSSTLNSLTIDKGLFSEEKTSGAQIFNTEGFVYIVVSTSEEEVANNQELPSETRHESKIVVIDKAAGEVVKDFSLDSDWEINSLSVGPDDTLVALLGNDSGDKAYSISPYGSKNPFKGMNKTIQQACSSKNKLYYLADGGRYIYEYSPSEEASYRLYNNPINTVSSIKCLEEGLYFVLSNEQNDELDLNFHYKLSDKPQVGARLDSALPIYYTVNQDTLKFSESSDGVVIDMLYDSDKNGGSSSKSPAKSHLFKILKEKGVDTTDLNVVYSY